MGQKEGRIQKRDKGSWENVQKCGSSGRDCWKKNYIQTNKTSGIKCTIQEREREKHLKRRTVIQTERERETWREINVNE